MRQGGQTGENLSLLSSALSRGRKNEGMPFRSREGGWGRPSLGKGRADRPTVEWEKTLQTGSGWTGQAGSPGGQAGDIDTALPVHPVMKVNPIHHRQTDLPDSRQQAVW